MKEDKEKEKKCCEMCIQTATTRFWAKGECRNKSCPCHLPQQEKDTNSPVSINSEKDVNKLPQQPVGEIIENWNKQAEKL